MLLKYFYDTSLAHASYLVGCQKTGEATIIDPGRDIEGYLEVAGKEDMRITGATDTHIHADYVSGARELAETCEAKLFLSDEGPEEWKYHYASEYDHQLLRDGDTFSIGKIEMKVMYTPGHTPESLSFVLTDVGGGASTPMGIFTGDFVFVGSIGRPDLLEKAAGMTGTAEAGAKDLYQSIQKFHDLPDHLQIWPAHGAGSACGKGLGSIPSSTVGYEKLYNPALQFRSEESFVDYILAEQPEAPRYFAIMKQVNKEGPVVLGGRPMPSSLDAETFGEVTSGKQIIDTRSFSRFAAGHAVGSISVPLRYLAAWAGWLVDYEMPLFLVSPPEDQAEVARILHKIGIEDLPGFYRPADLEGVGLMNETTREASPSEIAPKLADGELILVDVRGDTEWKEEHIPDAKRCFLAHLPGMLSEFSGDCSLAFQCRSGGRSAIATSLAQVAGIEKAINLSGGIHAWAGEGFSTVKDGTAAHHGPGDDASVSEGASQSQAVFWDAQCPV